MFKRRGIPIQYPVTNLMKSSLFLVFGIMVMVMSCQVEEDLGEKKDPEDFDHRK